MLRTMLVFIFISIGVLSLILFEIVIVFPALAPYPNGHYGEMYGPVTSLRWYVDGVCIALALVGVVLWVGKRRDHSPD